MGKSEEASISLWAMISSKACNLILDNTTLLQSGLIRKALDSKRATGTFTTHENSLEHELFKQLPDYVQEYILYGSSLSVVPENNRLLLPDHIAPTQTVDRIIDFNKNSHNFPCCVQ